MWILETAYGDKWSYDENEYENARKDKYIFGGDIIHINEDDKKILDKKRQEEYIIVVYFIFNFLLSGIMAL